MQAEEGERMRNPMPDPGRAEVDSRAAAQAACVYAKLLVAGEDPGRIFEATLWAYERVRSAPDIVWLEELYKELEQRWPSGSEEGKGKRMTIVEFLEARLEEDIDAAFSAREHFEAIAKRALVDKFKDADLGAPYTESPEVDHWDDWQVACYEVLSNLALIYCRHPDYRKEWVL